MHASLAAAQFVPWRKSQDFVHLSHPTRLIASHGFRVYVLANIPHAASRKLEGRDPAESTRCGCPGPGSDTGYERHWLPAPRWKGYIETTDTSIPVSLWYHEFDPWPCEDRTQQRMERELLEDVRVRRAGSNRPKFESVGEALCRVPSVCIQSIINIAWDAVNFAEEIVSGKGWAKACLDRLYRFAARAEVWIVNVKEHRTKNLVCGGKCAPISWINA
ncbi:hypothetical protein CYLTODRAFT_416409 [Cylindrobasidium torrendii FP15055 ss-10]|uniref:Uncharacterized protein n=1 Tax=Cylindrobasidium torrendii FP15055 ss-10 TaxID=1314674 RepID=A0A0D7BVD7_9AGAR|nr:hypothetical protein CYLTODRAFT_416409 [Cylindrobasidium torrendii FP15055 ss-10]